MEKMNNCMSNAQKTAVTKVGTAVILAAGMGSRMAPATACTPKALLPVGNKPAINYLLEECAAAEIWNIVVVVNRGQKKLFKKYLTGQVKMADYTKNFGMKKWIELRNQFHFRFVCQRKWRDGVGPMGSICAAKKMIGEGDFAVLMGDIIYPDDQHGLVPVVELHDYQHERAPLCSIHFNFLGCSQSEKPQYYGVIHPFTAIEKDDDDKFKDQYFFVDHIEEKPEKPNSELVIAGRYVFSKQIFTDLHNLENTKNNHFNNENILVEVLNDKAYKTLAMRAGDTFYDIGNRWGFITANAVLSQEIQKEKE